MHLSRKRIIALGSVLALVIAVTAVFTVGKFTDESRLYTESIESLTQQGVIKEDGSDYFDPEQPLTRSVAASMLYEAFDLVPVFSMEAPVTTNEDGTTNEPAEKEFYSTSTTVATLDAALVPAAPDAAGTWVEQIANTVLEARLLDQIDGTFQGDKTMTRSEFALAVMKAVYGADKEMDFLAQGQEDGLRRKI